MQVRPQKRDNAALVKSLEENIDNLDRLGAEDDPEKTTQRITLLSEEVNNADEAGKITRESSEKVLSPGHTQPKMNNLFWPDENSVEQCFAARIVQGCQQYCSTLSHVITG